MIYEWTPLATVYNLVYGQTLLYIRPQHAGSQNLLNVNDPC